MKIVCQGWRARLMLLLAVIGPGFITASVDNDAGGIFTYSQAGAQFGYTLLWTMIPITIFALVVIQKWRRGWRGDGQGTQRPHSRRIRLSAHVLRDAHARGHQLREHRGRIRGDCQQPRAVRRLQVRHCAAVSFCRVGHWSSAVRTTASRRSFLTASAFYVCYIVAGVLAHPDWKAAAFATVDTPQAAGMRDYSYVYMVSRLSGRRLRRGCSSISRRRSVEKGITVRQLIFNRASRWE